MYDPTTDTWRRQLKDRDFRPSSRREGTVALQATGESRVLGATRHAPPV